MSKKPQNKDKKNSDSQNLESVVEEQKRSILEQSFTINKLQDRLSRISEEHFKITTTKDQVQKNYEEKIDTQRIVIENHQNTIEKLNNKIHDLQIKKIELETIIKDLERNLNYSEQSRQRQMEQYKKLVASEMNILENQLKQYNHYMKERDELYKERNDLKKDLQSQRNDKVRELADKQRQKVQATDKLKDQMLMKIRDLRTNLLSLKKEQLSTTTRIAVLQNHQLTGQLQFQSKQTQKLIFENQSLQKKILNLQKDLEVHKDVEEELAKRSHLSKGIIKKLTTKIAQLEQQMSKQKSISMTEQLSDRKPEQAEETAKKQQMIVLLDKELQTKQKNYTKLLTDFQTMENEYKILKEKHTATNKKSLQLLHLLTQYYQQLLNGKIDLKANPDDEIIYDIKGLRQNNVQEWSIEQSKMVVNVLLNQLKNSLNKTNLGVPTINKSQILVISDDAPQTKLPKIGDHSLIKKETKGVREMPINMASKIVSSNLRQWGRTVHTHSVASLNRKYKVER